MPLDKGTRGDQPAPRRTVAALRRQEQREAKKHVQQRQAVRVPDSADAVRTRPQQKFEQKRNEEIERQYGTGRAGGNQQAPGIYGATVGPLIEGAAWSVANPRKRLTGEVPGRAPTRYSAAGLPMVGELSTGEFPWGVTGRFFRGRRVKPEAPTPEPVVPGADTVVSSLDEAKKLRIQQERLYRQERGKRGARSEEAAETVGGQEGYHAALRELKGELPKLRFGALDGQLDQPMVDTLFSHIQRHEDLRPYEKLNAQRALQNALEGKVPTRGDIGMLNRVFGPQVASQIADSVGFWAKAKNAGLQIINVPRALKSSFDLSAPFRQGLVLGARHPRMFATEFRPMLKAFRSESAYLDIMDDIASRPNFDAMQKGKLALTDLEGLSMREEQFMSNLAEKIPVVGRGVRASGRAYTAFLNKFRADAFDNYLDTAAAAGRDITDERLLRDIASWVNHATGRGTIQGLEGAMVPLNALLFSPRLIASRVKLLNPAYHAQLDPLVRKEALRGMVQLGGALSLTLWLAKLNGAEVGLDPRSADFAKIKLGDTRIDVAGGFQQYIVAGYRFAKRETVSASGEVTELEGGFAKRSRADIVARFARQKLAPVPAFGWDWASNENFTGDEFSTAKEGGRLFLPLGIESTYETANEYGPAAAAATFGLGGIGFGVQTYETKPPKKPQTRAQKFADAVKTEERTARKLGVPMPPAVRDALKLQSRLQAAVDKLYADQKERDDVVTPEGKRFKLTARQKANAEFEVIRKLVPEHAARLKQILDGLETERQIEAFRRQLKDELGLGVLEQWHEETADALEERALAAAG